MASGNTDQKLKGHLEKLLARAEEFCEVEDWESVHLLYRNKPAEYFDDIRINHNNVMKKYLKDNGGDPLCPLNGNLEGLFFGVTLFKGNLPDKSPYGNTRVTLPLAEAFDEETNLYFSDFFCLRGGSDNHYVQVVLTKDGSEADRFCQKNLIGLDTQKNEFLRKDGSIYVTRKDNIEKKFKVEVFYTEDLNLADRQLTKTQTLGQGHTTPGGIPKRQGCATCDV